MKSDWRRAYREYKSNSGGAVSPELTSGAREPRSERVELGLLAARVENDADRELEPVVSLPSILVRASYADNDPNDLKAIADHDGFVSLPPASYCPLVVNFWLGRNPLNDLPQQFCGVGALDYLPPRLVEL